jgi:hypothetical protein
MISAMKSQGTASRKRVGAFNLGGGLCSYGRKDTECKIVALSMPDSRSLVAAASGRAVAPIALLAEPFHGCLKLDAGSAVTKFFADLAAQRNWGAISAEHRCNAWHVGMFACFDVSEKNRIVLYAFVPASDFLCLNDDNPSVRAATKTRFDGAQCVTVVSLSQIFRSSSPEQCYRRNVIKNIVIAAGS